ncbi:toprim domain-containing protein [Sandaracinobacter sp. RS1-74]|uniref:DUF7146 domain-containing protein n=1 Tax=Sandaracinobacteroides sayramensis TaxID=2913411 RepID=UPI001EDA0349|nr:toprim domain-containing protein [Sandaracinobacteroides sayramensis]
MSRTIDLELETAGATIVKNLGGHWTAKGGLCLCPVHADRRPSLSVRVGSSSLLFHCFAGCDTIDVLRAIRRLKLDIPTTDEPAPRPAWQGRDAAIAARARALWNEARPLPGTPGEHYARWRGLPGAADALRYHPRTPLGPRGAARFRPALLAAVRAGDRVIGVERLFLDVPPGLPAADLDPAKRMLGRPFDGAIHFGVPSSVLGLAEGWETAWSAHILLRIPVWAALSNERFAQVAIPDRVERLILLPDDDPAGLTGAGKASIAHERPGRAIETLLPALGHNDWNDQLQSGGEEEGEWVRKAA